MAAALALGIHMDNKQKRKASALSVFLNVETQRKFMKMASNVELQKELSHRTYFYNEKQLDIARLAQRNTRLNERVDVHMEEARKSREQLHETLKQLGDTEKETQDLRGEVMRLQVLLAATA